MSSRMFRPLAAALCGFALLAATDAVAQDKVVVKIGSITMNDTVHNMMKDFKARVERRAGPRIAVDVFPLSQLGAAARQIEGVQLGTQEMVTLPPSFFVGVDRRFGVIDSPGVFDTVQQGQATVLDPEFAQKFWMLGEAKGMIGVGMYCSDPNMYAFRAPMQTLDDFKGKKIRVFASPIEFELVKRYGATAVAMSLEEVLPSLQQGVIDGVRSGLSIFVPLKFYTTAKYVVRTEETITCPIQMASKAWLDRLPADIRQIVTEEAIAANRANLAFSLAFLKQNEKIWTDNGGALVALSPADRAELRRRVATVGDEITHDKPAEREILDLLRKVAARHRS